MTTSLFTFAAVHRAYLDCRRAKRNKPTALAFEANAEENLFVLARELAAGTYRPSPSFCFVARNDKHREVFAAAFRDRVVHHLLIRCLEPIWEPVFIHDSYACRKGKGTHGAVARLQSFQRKATANQTRRAWFAQLDVKAFFPSIDRGILLDLVLARLHNPELRWLAETIILHDPTQSPTFSCSPDKWRHVPGHKSLFSVPPGKGLPIGNLTSQFLANVYLNSLDQFVKHALKVRYYLRYVDDFVLVHEDPEQLRAWRDAIIVFLRDTLLLELRPKRRILPVSNGVDFLGFVVRPSHLLVRRRVVANCKRALGRHEATIVRKEGRQTALAFPPERYDALLSMLNSYLGQFKHAANHGLVAALFRAYPFLYFLFRLHRHKAAQRWRPVRRPANLVTQYRSYRRRWRGALLMQVGCYYELFDADARRASSMLGLRSLPPRPGFQARCGVPERKLPWLLHSLRARDVLVVRQTGRLSGWLHERSAGAALMTATQADKRSKA